MNQVHYVGVDYCIVHDGIRNEDERDCDFADWEECVLRPLAWMADEL